jgi:hypothetical protein
MIGCSEVKSVTTQQGCNRVEENSYPNAPTPVLISKMGILSSVTNKSILDWR